MMGIVHPFPAEQRIASGAINVSGNSVAGFHIAHESASGESFGSFAGPFASGQQAITAAYVLSRDTYEGACDVVVCDAAVQDACPNVGLLSLPGDF